VVAVVVGQVQEVELQRLVAVMVEVVVVGLMELQTQVAVAVVLAEEVACVVALAALVL
jgi:hypothetical protein